MNELLVAVVTASKGVIVEDREADDLLAILSDCSIEDMVGLIAQMGGLLVRLLSDVAEDEGTDIDSFIQQWALRLAE